MQNMWEILCPGRQKENGIAKNQEVGDKTVLAGKQRRAVGRILGIEKNTCLYWIRKYAKTLVKKEVPNEIVEVIEVDELYSFIERKHRIYVMTLVGRDKRQNVGYDIAFDRSRENFKCWSIFL